jgi:hypothetical protein
LYRVFGTREAAAAEVKEEVRVVTAEAPILDLRDLIRKANEHFSDAQDKLRLGDFAGYGDALRQLQSVLTQLEERTEE